MLALGYWQIALKDSPAMAAIESHLLPHIEYLLAAPISTRDSDGRAALALNRPLTIPKR